MVSTRCGELGGVGAVTDAKRSAVVHGRVDIHAVEEEHVEVDVQVQRVPKRWISVTAPVWPVARITPALVSR